MKPATLNDYKRRLLRVLVHIQEHLDESLALEELAELACFSPFHFHRIFKGMVGESVKEHVRRLRLERAAGRLKLGAESIVCLALDAGYESHEAFTRSFRSIFGVSPSGFRSSERRARVAAAPSGLHFANGRRVKDFKTIHPGGNNMEVKIVRRAPLRVAFMRHIGPYSAVGKTWDRFLPVLGKEGLLGGDTQFIGICHDDPEVTPPGRVRYDACVSVDESFSPTGEIGVQVIAGGEYAMTTHVGPYRKLGQTYACLLGQWLPRSGRQLSSRPCFEVYLNDPQGTEPKDLLTDIYAPLAAQSRISAR
ncbi:MAG TPA: AraC family transcriptional regulator [Dongiaceae bacterium]|nr:AraC family transcriptional regulator [Dongiaceae bacterium]